MELILRTDGLGEAAGLLSRVGAASRESAGPLARIGRVVKSLSDLSPLEKSGAAAQETAGHFETLAARLVEVAKAYRDLGQAQKDAGRLRAPSARAAAEAPADGDTIARIGRQVNRRFLRGPNQRLAEIEAQRKVLPEVEDEDERTRIGKDLDRAERLASRSVILDQQRVDKPELQTGPGLLELFGDLNQLLRGAARGDVGGTLNRVRNLGFNIQHVLPPDELPGGLNVLQRLGNAERSRLGLGSAEQAGFAVPNGRGSLGDFNLPGSAASSIGNSRALSWLGNFGAGVQRAVPALGKVAALSGPLGAVTVGAGALALGAGAAAGGLFLAFKATEAFITNLNAASSRLRSFGAASFLSGGSASDVARLGAMGLPGSEIPGIAAGLRERLGSDPLAMGLGAQLGVGAQSARPFGATNEAALLVKTLDALRASEQKAIPVMGRLRAQEETLRRARILGIETAVELTRVSNSVWASMKRDAEIRARIFDDPTQQSARDYEAGLKRIGEAQDNLGAAFAKPFLKTAAAAVNLFADGVNGAADALSRIGDRIHDAGMAILGLLSLPLGPAASAVFREALRGFDDAAQKQREQADSATDAHTKAMLEHTKALRAGMTGGGQRANAAVPDRLRGWYADQAAQGQRMRYGGVTL